MAAPTPIEWVDSSDFQTENQKPVEFINHRFLIDLYEDLSKDIVVRKSAQVGESTERIYKAIWCAKFMKANVIYVLPTNNVVKDFVAPKVNPIIDSNPGIQDLVVGKDSESLKQIGERFIYFRGAFSEREAIAISGDILILDEYDRMPNPAIINTYDSRLQASEHGHKWILSNPSAVGFGVDELYKQSDQMHWFITCRHCNHTIFIDFELDPNYNNHYVNQEKEQYVCGKCHKELSNADRRNGEWVAKFATRTKRGYWISQLMAPWVSAARIMEQFKESTPEFFYNFVLGKAYTASDILLDRESLIRATTPGTIVYDEVYIGVDNGVVKHYVIGTPRGVFKYGKTESWDEIEQLFLTYNAKCMVIDANPYPTYPKKLTEKYPGKVFVNFYIQDQKGMSIIRWLEKDKKGVVHSDRTKIMDTTVAEIQNKDFTFFMNVSEMEEYIYQATNVYRTVETNNMGVPTAKWLTKENKPDHLLHATVYYRIACTKSINKESSIVSPKLPTEKKSYIVEDGKLQGMHIDPIALAKESNQPTKDWKHN